MTNEERNQLQEAYLAHLLDGMSGRDLERFFLDAVAEYLEAMPEGDFLEEVRGVAPELVGG